MLIIRIKFLSDQSYKNDENYDQSVEINHNPNWPYIPDHLYRILIIGGSGSEKTNLLLSLIKHQRPDIDKIYLYIKNPFELMHQLVINGSEKIVIELLKNPKAFIDYSQTIDGVYEHLEDYNPTKKRRVLVILDDMIADMEEKSNEKLSNYGIVFTRKKTQYFTCFYITILFQSA